MSRLDDRPPVYDHKCATAGCQHIITGSPDVTLCGPCRRRLESQPLYHPMNYPSEVSKSDRIAIEQARAMAAVEQSTGKVTVMDRPEAEAYEAYVSAARRLRALDTELGYARAKLIEAQGKWLEVVAPTPKAKEG